MAGVASFLFSLAAFLYITSFNEQVIASIVAGTFCLMVSYIASERPNSESPYKGMFGPRDNTLSVKFTRLETEHGDLDGIKTDNQWPMSKILLCSRNDFQWGHFETESESMNWRYISRGAEELGAFQRSWNMGGDFSMQCNNVTHLRLLDGIETRKELYPARSNFL